MKCNPIKCPTNTVINLFALILASTLSPFTWAQSFPSKPVRLIVPAEPGGGLDIPARSVAQGLAQRFNQDRKSTRLNSSH